mmetsp:Transcript_14503/g.21877  ORF Transcript_14503/g.21877 Transcript_14503/m.21877 type:complete len:253 (+) Transcript_14503:180-938(+)
MRNISVSIYIVLVIVATMAFGQSINENCIHESLKSMFRANMRRDQYLKVPKEFQDEDQYFYDVTSCSMAHGNFSTANMRESGKSSTSETIVRQRAMMLMLAHVLNGNHDSVCLRDLPRGLRIYNTEAHGAIHNILSTFPGYVASEFVSNDATPGSMHLARWGKHIRHEDLRQLSFPDETFDVILSAEVLEHIPKPYDALAEILRVLKPGGIYLWTVPLIANTDAMDVQLSMLNEDGVRFDRATPSSGLNKGY